MKRVEEMPGREEATARVIEKGREGKERWVRE